MRKEGLGKGRMIKEGQRGAGLNDKGGAGRTRVE